MSDGKHVWVLVGTGVVACYDLEGTRRWINGFDLPLTTMYGRTASPVLVGERLLVHFGPLVCLDAATGKLLWKCDNAKATYGTPARTRIGDTDVVITWRGRFCLSETTAGSCSSWIQTIQAPYGARTPFRADRGPHPPSVASGC